MIKFAICDDDKDFCNVEQEEIKRVMERKFPHLSFIIDIYYNVDSILDEYPKKRQDVIFLDIEIGEQNGFDVAGVLNRIDSHVNIVFITTHNNLIYDSFEYRPVGFVEKLHFNKDFEKVINRIIHTMITQHRIIELGKDKNKVQFLCDKVHMVEAFKHEIIVKCENGSLMIKDQFGKNQDMLKSNGFMLVSRGVMVNKKFVRCMDGRQIRLYDGTIVSIGRSRYKAIKEEFEREKINRIEGN